MRQAKPSSNKHLLEFERRTALGPTYAARLLCVAYVTYAQYRNGSRDLPPYCEAHMRHLLRIPDKLLRTIIEEDIHGNR
ncbi:hypothetical protein D3C87_812810 [compost metagenome]